MLKILPFIFVLLLWLITFYQGLSTAINVWSISEIFTHCFFVVPGAFYLIFKKRQEVLLQPIKPNYWLLAPLSVLLALQTFGAVGDIRLFMHIATFASLPLLIWLMLGNKAAKVIFFPLYFMLFAIPIGEQLIPYLQELTTDLAVPLLELTGVPIFRNGLYLDIPAGRFLVAEACSGISFLIASMVFGNLYAYLSFKTLTKQISFVLISLLVPILANAIRVYGIVLTAHLTDMEYAAGADHLIYGGVFYGVILFLLIMIGERFRDKDLELSLNEKQLQQETTTQLWPVSLVIATLFSFQYIWINTIEDTRTPTLVQSQLLNLEQLPFAVKQQKLTQWQPYFPNAYEIKQGFIPKGDSGNIDFFIASFNRGKGELISSMNKLYDADRWTLVSRKTIILDGGTEKVYLIKLASPLGASRYIMHWYQLGRQKFTSDVKAKLFQTSHLLFGRADHNALMAFSLLVVGDDASTVSELQNFIESNLKAIDTILPSNDDA